MSTKLPKLLWDDWNASHIAKHNVTVYEVETALKDKKAVYLRSRNNRRTCLARCKRRLLMIVLSRDSKTRKDYVVTARDMDKKERSIYRNEQNT